MEKPKKIIQFDIDTGSSYFHIVTGANQVPAIETSMWLSHLETGMNQFST